MPNKFLPVNLQAIGQNGQLVQRPRPVAQPQQMPGALSGFVAPSATIQGAQLVNPQLQTQIKAQEITGTIPAKVKEKQALGNVEVQQKLTEADVLPLNESASRGLSNSASLVASAQKMKEFINSDRFNPVTFLADPEVDYEMRNIQTILTNIRTGAGSSDRERAALKKLGPLFTDFITQIASPRPASAIMVNKLGALAAEAQNYGNLIGGQNRFNEALKNIKSLRQSFSDDDSSSVPERALQDINKEIERIQSELNKLNGVK